MWAVRCRWTPGRYVPRAVAVKPNLHNRSHTKIGPSVGEMTKIIAKVPVPFDLCARHANQSHQFPAIAAACATRILMRCARVPIHPSSAASLTLRQRNVKNADAADAQQNDCTFLSRTDDDYRHEKCCREVTHIYMYSTRDLIVRCCVDCELFPLRVWSTPLAFYCYGCILCIWRSHRNTMELRQHQVFYHCQVTKKIITR
jgi:hypothetical protein